MGELKQELLKAINKLFRTEWKHRSRAGREKGLKKASVNLLADAKLAIEATGLTSGGKRRYEV